MAGTDTIQNLTALGDLLKRVTEIGVEKQYNDEDSFFNRIKKKTAVWGEQIEHMMLMRGPINSGMRNGSSDTLPLRSIPRVAKYTFTPKYGYQRGEIYGDVLERASGGAASALNALEMDTKAHREKLVFELIRQMHGDGGAKLAKITSASTTVPTVDSTWFLEGDATENMNVDVFSGNTRTDSDKKISAVNHVTRTITVDTLGGDRTNCFIMRKGNKADAATDSHEFMGLQGIVNTASGNSDDDAGLVTLQGVSRTTWPIWESIVHHNSGTDRAVSAAIINRFLAQMVREVKGGTMPKTALLNSTLYVEVAALLAQDRRYSSNKFDGGDGGVNWSFAGGKPIKFEVDRFIQPERSIYFVNLDELTLYQSKGGIDFLRSGLTGQKFTSLAETSNVDAVAYSLYICGQLVTDSCRSHGRIMDLSIGSFSDPISDKP